MAVRLGSVSQRRWVSGAVLCVLANATAAVTAPVAVARPMDAPRGTVRVAQTPIPPETRPDPNRDRLIQPGRPPTQPPPTGPVLPDTPTAPETPETPETPDTPIPVTRIDVEGSTIFGPADFAPITQPLEGRSVTLEELRQAADAITQLYLNEGYITSRAVLTDQTIVDGVVKIQVIEGSLERIDIEGTQRLKPSYIRSRIELGARPPLSRDRLEDQLRLLKADPLFENVEASLRPGTDLGKSILVVRVTEANPFVGFISSDNYSPPSVGGVRVGGGAIYRNLTGIGDEIFGSYYRSTAGGSNLFDFSYRVPVNAMNGTVQLRASPSDSEIVVAPRVIRDLNITSRTELYELSYRQPLIRNPREELALSLGFTYQDSQTFLDGIAFPFGTGPDDEGRSRTRVLKFGQDYIRRDPQGAWAFRSLFSFGLGLFGATENDGDVPDGRFFSWLAQVQRVQRLGNNHLLIVQADLQLTPNSLLPSQQFVVGGGQSLRGFRQNVRSGDNGFRLSVEDRIAILRDEAGLPILQIAPFFDMGAIWNKSGNPNTLPDQRFLAGVGLGILWQPLKGLNIRLDGALPLVNLDDRGNDAQDEAFYFTVNYTF